MLKIMASAAAMATIVLSLTACSSSAGSSNGTPIAKQAGDSSLIDETTTYQGRTLHCIGEDDIHYSRTSCDFTRFYDENRDLLHYPAPAATPSN